MEKKLSVWFDYQKFEGNADLQRVIDSVHARHAAKPRSARMRELTMDELDWVAAAGSPYEEKKDEFTRYGKHLHDLQRQGDGLSPGKDP